MYLNYCVPDVLHEYSPKVGMSPTFLLHAISSNTVWLELSLGPRSLTQVHALVLYVYVHLCTFWWYMPVYQVCAPAFQLGMIQVGLSI